MSTWTQTRDASTNKYGLNSVQAVFQGSGGGLVLTNTNAYVTTQEGQTGIARIPFSGIPALVINGYQSAQPQYNNIRQLAGRGSYIVGSCSTGADVMVALDLSLNIVQNNIPQGPNAGKSHAIDTDGTWIFATVDVSNTGGTLPSGGQLVCTRISDGLQLTYHSGVDWSNGGAGSAYWLFVDTVNQRLTVSTGGQGTYLFDYSPLYLPTPAVPTLYAGWPVAALGVGFPRGNRVYAIDLNAPSFSPGFIFRTWNISTLTSPTVIGGSSDYQASHPTANPQYWNTFVFDAANGLFYLPFGGVGSPDCGTDVLAVNFSTDAVTLKHHIPGFTINGVVQSPTTAAISPDGTKYGISDEYSGSMGVVLYDVSAIAGGGSESFLSQFPCSAEPRSVIIVPGDTAAYAYHQSRYEFQVVDAADKMVSILNVAGAPLPSLNRSIGVTSGTDPHGTTGPTTTPDYFLLPNADGSTPFVVQCHGGIYQNLTIPTFPGISIKDSFWDGKYLWTIGELSSPTSGRPYVTVSSVTYLGGAWTISALNSFGPITTPGHDWFSGMPQASIMLVPGTSYDANTARVLIAVGWDAQHFPLDQSPGSGVHLLSFPNSSAAVELTTGIFPDPVIESFPDVNTTATIAVSGGGSPGIPNPSTNWFQLAYLDGTTLVGITAIPAGGNAGTNVPLAGSKVVLTNPPTPPALATQILVGYSSTFGTGQTFDQATASFVQYSLVPASATSITIQGGGGGAMPSPGNVFPTAGDLMNMARYSHFIVVPWGDYGVRVYDMNTNTLATALTASGTAGYSAVPLVSSISIFTDSIVNPGDQYLIANHYGASPGNVGNGILIWGPLGSSAPSGLPTWLHLGNEGFTVGSNDTLQLIWGCMLNGIAGFTLGGTPPPSGFVPGSKVQGAGHAGR